MFCVMSQVQGKFLLRAWLQARVIMYVIVFIGMSLHNIITNPLFSYRVKYNMSQNKIIFQGIVISIW